MSDAHPADALEMRWLSVRTASGRTRMEAVWITVDRAVASEVVQPVGHGRAA